MSDPGRAWQQVSSQDSYGSGRQQHARFQASGGQSSFDDQEFMQPQQPYETYRTLPAQYSYGPPADSYGNHPSYAPGQQQHPPQPQTLAMGYGPPPPSVSYKSTYTPHLHQHLQQLEQSPISYMTVDEPTSAGGSGGGQHSPTRPMVTAAAASDTRQSSSSTNRTSFSNDPGSAGGSHRASTTRISGRKGSLPAASKAEPLVIDEDEGDGKKKRKRVERACFTCRQKRSKCDGQQPCALCVHNKLDCVYPPPTRKVTIKYVEELEAKLAALDRAQTKTGQGSPTGHTSRSGSGSSSRAPDRSGPDSPKVDRRREGTQPLSPRSESRRVSVDSAAPGALESAARQATAYPTPSILPPGITPSSGSGSTQGQPSHEASGSGRDSLHGAYSSYGQQPSWESYPTAPPSSSYSRPEAAGSAGSQRPPTLPTVANVTAMLREHPPAADGDDDDGPPGLGRAHTDFNPGEDTMSSADEDGDQRRLMGDGARWERQGRDGRQTDLVEQGAARLAGEHFTSSAAFQPGYPVDDFVTQALAPAASYEEMYELPDPKLAADLLTFYEQRIHWLFPVIHFPSVLKKYRHICEAGADATHQYSTKEQIDLATTNLLFAITCAIRSAEGDATLIGVFFRRSQALTSGSTVLLLANVDIINYLNLLSMFSQSCSKGNLSSNATGLAINMSRGLQLETAKVNDTFDPYTKMLRQRAWAGCLVMEPTSSVMLYRTTGTYDTDFRDECLPEPIDDDDVRPDGSIVPCAPGLPRMIDYFIYLSRLMSVKASILRDVYNLAQRPTFPDTHQVLKLEDRLFAWRRDLPEHLSNPNKAPKHGPFRDQALKLQLRYANVRVLLYRPFLYHFCTTPGGSKPEPTSLKFEMARKSAHVCQEAAIEVLETISEQWNTSWAGWWWWSLAFVYCASLATLAHRIMNATYKEPDTPYYEKLSVSALDKALDLLKELGWAAEGGVETADDERRRIIPPKSLVSTARRCYRIVSSIDKSIRQPGPPESDPKIESLPKVSAKQADPYRNKPVPPGRYSRKPDHALPPLRLSNTSPTYSDDNFIRNWVNLMPASQRSPSFVPNDFVPPAVPFDMSVRQENPEASVSDRAWQDWASLLGTGYLSNLGVSEADEPGGVGGLTVESDSLNLTAGAGGATYSGTSGSMLENIWASTGDDRGEGLGAPKPVAPADGIRPEGASAKDDAPAMTAPAAAAGAIAETMESEEHSA